MKDVEKRRLLQQFWLLKSMQMRPVIPWTQGPKVYILSSSSKSPPPPLSSWHSSKHCPESGLAIFKFSEIKYLNDSRKDVIGAWNALTLKWSFLHRLMSYERLICFDLACLTTSSKFSLIPHCWVSTGYLHPSILSDGKITTGSLYGGPGKKTHKMSRQYIILPDTDFYSVARLCSVFAIR